MIKGKYARKGRDPHGGRAGEPGRRSRAAAGVVSSGSSISVARRTVTTGYRTGRWTPLEKIKSLGRPTPEPARAEEAPNQFTLP